MEPRNKRDALHLTQLSALMTLLREVEGYGFLWTAEGLSEAVRHVIVDEADLLMTGGYERDLNNILEVSGSS